MGACARNMQSDSAEIKPAQCCIELVFRLSYSSMNFHFYSSIWRMQNIWSAVDLLSRNPHWWSPIIPSAYGINLDSRMLDTLLYTVEKKVICVCNYYKLFYCSSYKQVMWSRHSTPLAIPPYPTQNPRANCSTLCFNKFCWDLINTC